MRALLVGYGKMGKAIEAVLGERGHEIAGRWGRDETSLRHPSCDIAFEFTSPASAPEVVRVILSRRIPVVSGTTGWDVGAASQLARELEVPFLHASNFSLGVAALRRAVAAVAGALAPFPEFEPGIVERHHAAKKDAPSGTARTLALDIQVHAESPGLSQPRVFDPPTPEPASTGTSSHEPRPSKPVPIVSLRQGAQPGEHAVFFEGTDETVEIVHRARSRSIFARGAVRAGEWMIASGRTGPLKFDEFFDDISRKGGPS